MFFKKKRQFLRINLNHSTAASASSPQGSRRCPRRRASMRWRWWRRSAPTRMMRTRLLSASGRCWSWVGSRSLPSMWSTRWVRGDLVVGAGFIRQCEVPYQFISIHFNFNLFKFRHKYMLEINCVLSIKELKSI